MAQAAAIKVVSTRWRSPASMRRQRSRGAGGGINDRRQEDSRAFAGRIESQLGGGGQANVGLDPPRKEVPGTPAVVTSGRGQADPGFPRRGRPRATAPGSARRTLPARSPPYNRKLCASRSIITREPVAGPIGQQRGHVDRRVAASTDRASRKVVETVGGMPAWARMGVIWT